MSVNIYYDDDADLSIIQGRKVAVIGYGSQGHAHALNLKESGCAVTVGLYEGSSSWPKAEGDGLAVATIADAVREADVVMMLLPDEKQPAVFEAEVGPYTAIVDGDSRCYTIACASVVAKVVRDRLNVVSDLTLPLAYEDRRALLEGVMSPGERLNVNADTAATAVAQSLGAEKLVRRLELLNDHVRAGIFAPLDALANELRQHGGHGYLRDAACCDCFS
mgnify:CR=1 FL=1